MKPQMAGGNSLTPQRPGHPKVSQKAPGPQAKQVDYKGNGAPAPSSGQTKRNMQSGSTSPQTDAGGGMGNSSVALHKMICGK